MMTAKQWMTQLAKYGEKMPDKEETVVAYPFKKDVFLHFLGKMHAQLSNERN